MRSWVRRLAPVLSLTLFLAALWILHRELRQFRYQDVAGYLRSLPRWDVALALALTAGSYWMLTAYDALGFRYAGRRLGYRRVAAASFIGYSFTNSVGHALLTGMPIRFRLYSAWGVTTEEIAKVVAFCFLTFWAGFLSLAGVVFTAFPGGLPPALRLPFGSELPIGLCFLGLTAGYLIATFVRRAPVRVGGWSFLLPAPGLAVAQIAVATADWLLTAGVLYVLLPPRPDLGFAGFLGFFLLAQMAGFLSQIPGGLGVFETVFVLLLAPSLPAASVVGGLLAFRAIYYLTPLVAATALLAGHELRLHRAHLGRAVEAMGRWVPAVVPHALAFTTFLGGTILLFSGATPPLASRFSWLNELLPLPVIETSHFLGSLAGVGLLVLARGLQRRLDVAFHLTAVLLAVGIVASLLKGLDYEEAVSLAVMLALLLPCHGSFYRRASLVGGRFTRRWLVAIGFVLIATVWLTLFSFKHVEYAQDLWWSFAIHGHAPRSLRALVGAAVGVAAFAAARLVRSAPPEPDPPDAAAIERAAAIATASPRTYAYLALLGDKRLLFSDAGNAFLMYAVEGRSWVAMGDPVGPGEEADELAWRLADLAEHHGGWPVFYQVGEETLGRYVDMGMAPLKLGEEAMVPLVGFSLDGGARKGLRQNHRRVIDREGCSFEVLPAERVPALIPELAAVSGAWLAEKNAVEKSFSLGRFDPAYVARFPLAVVRQAGRVVAFANLWIGAGREEISIDLMRYGSHAPPGVMSYLFTELMLWGAAEGYRWFSLGMAPLSGLDGRAGDLWQRLAGLVYRHGEHFYNFQGLRRYKEKFLPVWHPRYLVTPGGFALPQILTNVTTLISGGVRGVFSR